MHRRSVLQAVCAGGAVCAISAGLLIVPATVAGASAQLGRGRYSRLYVFLEKTILRVDVLSLTVRVDQRTADRLEGVVKGREYTPALERTIVSVLLEASAASSALQFLRDIPIDKFMAGMRAEVYTAYQAGLTSRREYSRVYHGLPEWFGVLGKRGIREGDWLYNEGTLNGVRTVYVDKDGRTLIDVTAPGPEPLRTLLASFLAPGRDLREPLIRSLFD